MLLHQLCGDGPRPRHKTNDIVLDESIQFPMRTRKFSFFRDFLCVFRPSVDFFIMGNNRRHSSTVCSLVDHLEFGMRH